MIYDAEMLVAHHLAYDFLSRLFYESPRRDFIQLLVSDDLFECWPLESTQAEVQTGLDVLRAFSSSWHDARYGALKADYARLFVGPDHLLAPPWESVYRSPEHILFDYPTLEVRQHYQRFGMPIPRLNVEPDDHIGLEFRFLTHLCRLSLAALEQEQPDILATILTEMRAFVDEHLLRWAPEFLLAVIDNAQTDFYRGSAHLALGCLSHTHGILQCPVLRPEAEP